MLNFNEKLQELRKKKNLTQEELAQALFVSRTAISKWESGRGYPSIDSLKELSKFFGVTIYEVTLLGLTEYESYLKAIYFIIVIGLIICGVLTIALHNYTINLWNKSKAKISLSLSALGALVCSNVHVYFPRN